MPRYIRNTAILAKIETTYGTDAAPTGAANAILVSNCTLNPLAATNVKRDLIRPYFGGSEELVGPAYVEATFDVEFQNGGAAGVAPAWGPLMRAGGFAEGLLTAPARVEYTPVSSGFESVTIYYYLDGVLRKLLGARGDFSYKLGIGNRPVMSFKFLGLDGGIAAATPGALTLTGFKAPKIVTDANSGDILLGCTYSIGALSGGTAYPSKGLDLSMGNAVNHIPLLGGESVDITNRDVTGKLALDLSAANDVAFMATVKANTLQTLGWSHGSGAGYQMMIFAPAVQIINPKYEDTNGRAMNAYDLRLTPSAGNDELRIIAL